MNELTIRLYQALDWERQSFQPIALSNILPMILSLNAAFPQRFPLLPALRNLQRPAPKRQVHTTKDGQELIEEYPFWTVSIKHRDQIRYLEEFSEKFKALLNMEGSPVRDKDARLVVFIDDLDRTLPEHALNVLETLKLFLNVEKTVFILGVDPTLLEKGIRHHYHWQDPSPIQVHRYLDKIIHLPFRIPEMKKEALGKYARALLAQNPFPVPEIGKFDPIETPVEFLKAGAIRNPRHIKQLVNLWISFLAYLEGVGLKMQELTLTPATLFAMLMAKRQWPDFYHTWVQNPGLIFKAQAQESTLSRETEDDQTSLDRFLKEAEVLEEQWKGLLETNNVQLYRTMNTLLEQVPLVHLHDEASPPPAVRETPVEVEEERRPRPVEVREEQRPSPPPVRKAPVETQPRPASISLDALRSFQSTLSLHFQKREGDYRITAGEAQWDFIIPWEAEALTLDLYRAGVLTKSEAQKLKIDLTHVVPFRGQERQRAYLKSLGDQLYDSLFPPAAPIRRSVEELLQAAKDQGRLLSLRLQLDPDDPDLWAFPWELLYAHWLEENGTITASFTQTLRSLAILRYLPKAQEPIITRLQRIAFFAAQPKDAISPIQKTLEAIRKAWGVDRVQLAVGQSWEDWQALMGQPALDAAHFLGHGDAQDRLAFVKEENWEDWRAVQEIAASLPASLKLLVLQAPSSSHLAATLIGQTALPLAVGMHYEIAPEAAEAFTQGFYRTLLTGGRVEVALAQARLQMINKRSQQWLLPVLTMGVPEVYFSTKVFPQVSRALPILTNAIEREQLPALREKLFQHPLLALSGKPGSGRTWLALQALEKAGFPREQTLLFDLSQSGDITALWHDLLNTFNRPEVAHLEAPELTDDRWGAMKKGLIQALRQEPHALLIKLPQQPPQGESQQRGWQALFEALRAARPPQVEHPTQTLLLIDVAGEEAWRGLIGQDVPFLSVRLSEQEMRSLLRSYGFPVSEEANEEIRLRLSDVTFWQLRQWLESYQGPKDSDTILNILESKGFSLEARWERFSSLEQAILQWAAIADAPLTATDLLSLLNRPDLPLESLEESLHTLSQAAWLQVEGAGYTLAPPARPFVREQMEPPVRRERLEQWHLYRARVQRTAQVNVAFDEKDFEQVATLLLGEAWHPWAISLSSRNDLLKFINELWKKKDGVSSETRFKLALRAAEAARALGDYKTAVEWYERADKLAPTPEAHLQARIEAAFLRHRIGAFNEGVKKEIEGLLAEVQDPQRQAQWQFTLGTIHAEQLHYDQAVNAVEAGLKALGLTEITLSPEEAAETFPTVRRALKRWVRQGNSPLLAAQAMRAYGLAMLYRDNLDLAEQAFRLSLRFYEEVGDRYMIAIAHNNLGAALNRAGKIDEAEEHFQKARPILRQLGDPAFAQMLQHFNGALRLEFQLASYPKEIIPGIEKGLSIARDYRYLQALVPILFEYGKALAMGGRWQDAASAIEESQRVAHNELRNLLMAGWGALYGAEINFYGYQAGKIKLSLATLSQWVKEQEPPKIWQQDPMLEIASRILLAQAAVLQEKVDEAEEIIAPIRSEALHDPSTLAKWHQLQGTLCAAKGDDKGAEAAFEEGLKQQGLVVYRTQLRYHYARALIQGGDMDGAQTQLKAALDEARQMEIPWLQEMITQLQAQLSEGGFS